MTLHRHVYDLFLGFIDVHAAKIIKLIAALGLFGLLAACDDGPKKKTWVVLELVFADGAVAKVALDSPEMRGKSVRQCENTKAELLPELLEIVHQQPEAKSAEILHAKCVSSFKDPVMTAQKDQ